MPPFLVDLVYHVFLLSLYMRDNEKCNIPHAPYFTGLSGTQFSALNSSGINDPEGPEKYNT
jgi:hypothetical protein